MRIFRFASVTYPDTAYEATVVVNKAFINMAATNGICLQRRISHNSTASPQMRNNNANPYQNHMPNGLTSNYPPLTPPPSNGMQPPHPYMPTAQIRHMKIAMPPQASTYPYCPPTIAVPSVKKSITNAKRVKSQQLKNLDDLPAKAVRKSDFCSQPITSIYDQVNTDHG